MAPPSPKKGGSICSELSAADEAKAKALYKKSMKSSEADGLDLFKFKGAVIELCLGEGHELPTEKDITMAFETADMDKSGLVDEEEFLELYSHVKDGNVKGLAGGYFSKKKKIVVKAAVAKSDPDSFEAKARQADLKAKEAAAKAAAAEKKAAEDKAAAAAKAKAAEEEAAAKKASEAKVAQDAAIVKAAKKGSKFMALLKVLGEVLVALAIIALITLVFTKVVDHPPLAEVVEEVTTKKRGRR